MGTLHYLDCLTRFDIPADRVLEGARGELKSAIVIGISSDGSPYFASSLASQAEILWLLEKAKMFLLESEEGD